MIDEKQIHNNIVEFGENHNECYLSKYNNLNRYNNLFRCIYVEPKYQKIVSIGNIEEHLFSYRNPKNELKKINAQYNKCIKTTFRKVQSYLLKICDQISKHELNPEIIDRLLIKLRYLTKHAGFKEEQECRILHVCSLDDKNIMIDTDFKKMYLEYVPVHEHIERLIFGSKAVDVELFQEMLINKGINVLCKRATNILS